MQRGRSMSARTGAAAILAGLLASAIAHRSRRGDRPELAEISGLGLRLAERADRQGVHQGVGGRAAQGLPDAEPGQPAGHEGGHQALHRDRRLPAAGRRCPTTSSCSRARCIPTVSLLRQRLLLSGDLQRGRQFAELRPLRRQGGEALSGLQRPGADGHRRQAHHRGPQRAGGRAPQAAQEQPRAPDPSQPNRPARNTSSSTSRPPRSRWSRAIASSRAIPAWWASPTVRRRS